MLIRSLVVLFSVLILAGCSSDSDNPLEESINFTILQRGSNSLLEMPTKRLMAIREQAELDQVWPTISSLPTPVIGASTIVIAELGTLVFSSPMAGIELESIVENSDHTEVFITTFMPGSNCPADDGFSTPFDAVQFERTREPILFRERLVIVDC